MPRPRSPLKSLAALLDGSETLIALIDDERRLVYASAPCAAWLGAEIGELLGRECLYSSEPQDDPLLTLLARIAPPPDVFRGVQVHGEVSGQAAERRMATFLPLALKGGQYAALVFVDAKPLEESLPESKPSAAADWHAILTRIRGTLPANLESEYLLGDSAGMRRLREQVELAARSRARVVVVAPPGGGAQDIAARIHAAGAGRSEGLMSLDARLQDAETLQAAFRTLSRKRSDADERNPAILLRDVGQLPEAAQQELLGFLRLPGFEVRSLATSRLSLAGLVKHGKLASDLAALLGTLEIRVPPLKQRPEDVPPLAQLFLERSNAIAGKELSGFVPEAVEQLVAYDWPENVDEVRQVVEEACQRAIGPWILASDLGERLRGNWANLVHPRRKGETIDLDAFLADVERDLLQRALAEARGNKSEASRMLGVSRPRLLRRLVQLGLATKEEAIDFQPMEGSQPLGDAS